MVPCAHPWNLPAPSRHGTPRLLEMEDLFAFFLIPAAHCSFLGLTRISEQLSTRAETFADPAPAYVHVMLAVPLMVPFTWVDPWT